MIKMNGGTDGSDGVSRAFMTYSTDAATATLMSINETTVNWNGLCESDGGVGTATIGDTGCQCLAASCRLRPTSVHLCLLCRVGASKSSVKCNGVIPHILVDKCC